MDIVVVATSFPRFTGDHAGRFVLDASRGLAERGHRLLHVVPEAEGARAHECLGEGLDVSRFPFARTARQRKLVYGNGIGANLKARPDLVFAVPGFMRSMKRALRDAMSDRPEAAILSHWVFPAGLVAADLCSRSCRAHVGIAHGGGLQLLSSRRWFHGRLGRWRRGTDELVFVSEDLREKAEAVLGDLDDATIVPMGCDTDAVKGDIDGPAHRVAAEIDENAFVIASVGRLVALKGFDLLVRAVSEMDRRVVILLAGEGPEREHLGELARSLDVDLRFLGHLGRDELPSVYGAADVFCAPSRLGRRNRSEGSPVVVGEAFANGLPVIASRSGGLRAAVVDGESGLLFGVDDAGALRHCLQRVVDDPDLRARLSRGARAAAGAFDYRTTAASLEATLHRAVARVRDGNLRDDR